MVVKIFYFNCGANSGADLSLMQYFSLIRISYYSSVNFLLVELYVTGVIPKLEFSAIHFTVTTDLIRCFFILGLIISGTIQLAIRKDH